MTTILHAFPTFAVGGAQMRFAAIANRFGARYSHIIYAISGVYGATERLGPSVDAVYPALAMRPGETLRNARSFRQVLSDLRPDVLVSYNWGSIEWAVANAVPVTRHIHIEDGFGPEEQDVQLRRRVLMRRAFLRHAITVLPSRSLWRIASDTWRLPIHRLRYVPNGVDLARFHPAPHGAWVSDSGADGPVIGTVATLRPEKNIPRLIEAFARLGMPARLVIAGGGPDLPALQALAERTPVGGRIQFTGPVADPAPLYRSFDLFALSSDTEQMPLSVLEAMATGLPVVSTNVGDVLDMLPEASAAFVVERDVGALAAAFAELLRSPEQARNLGRLNRAKAERDFAQETMFQAHAALLDGREPDTAAAA